MPPVLIFFTIETNWATSCLFSPAIEFVEQDEPGLCRIAWRVHVLPLSIVERTPASLSRKGWSS